MQDSITKGSWNFNLGHSWRFVQRSYRRQAGRAPRRHRLQHQAQQHRASRFLRAYSRDSFQRKPRAFQHRLHGPRSQSAARLLFNSLTPLSPGYRNEFHAGLQQAFGRHVVFDGEYIWKYTHNGYDFSVLGNTPITFPVEWARSKIPGFAARVNLTNLRGFTAYMVMSSVAARFFTPQVGGAGATPGRSHRRFPH